MERYDGQEWPKETLEAGMLLDAAVGSDFTVATSVFPILVSKDGGSSYSHSESLAGAVQDAQIIGNSMYLTGSFVTLSDFGMAGSSNGVARSTDGGDTWSISAVPEGYARYGAFPSEVSALLLRALTAL